MDQRARTLPWMKGRNSASDDANPPLLERLPLVEVSSHLSTRVGEAHPAAVHRATGDSPGMGRLKMLGNSERHQILYEWNDTEAEFPRDKCVHQMFEEQAARSPEATALVFENTLISYGELNRRSNQLAHYLSSLGVRADALVAVYAERSIEMVVALLAVLKAGGAYVPLEPAYPHDRLRYMLEDSAPVALLTQRHLAGFFAGFTYAGPVLDIAAPAPAWQDQPETNPDGVAIGLQPSHLAYVIYTSGSTGRPKGVMIEHRSLVNRLVWMQDAYGLDAGDAVLQKTPFSFDVSVWEFFWPLLTGAKLVMARPEGHKDPSYLVETISRDAITTLHFVPSMLQVFLDQADARQCSSLVRVIASGEALPAALVRRFQLILPHVSLHNLYGPTETTVDVTAWTCSPDPALANVPIGRPIANTRAYILDDREEPVPVGVEGELYIGGVGVARGYLNRPELTAERFVSDPFAADDGARMYRTGDLCRWRADGAIEYLGRNDFQVKIRGFRIELGEIEARLAQLANVREAVVIAREDTPGDKRLVAYIVPSTGAEIREGDLRDSLARDLPDFMVPSSFVALERMPVSVNGKLDRAALPPPATRKQPLRETSSSPRPKKANAETNGNRNGLASIASKVFRKSAYVPPSDTLEVELIGIWEEILGLTHIGVRDDFFELGGHSLLAARMFARISDKLHKKLPFATLFRGATIEKLAEVIRAEGWTSHWSVLVPIHEAGSKPPLFLVHGLRGNVLTFYGLRHHIPADQPLYGLQADGLGTGRASLVSIPEMAEYYIKEMRSVQPHGPYFLGGFSAGGLVAYEMARQLHAAGERVPFLALFDSYVEAAGGYWLKSFYSKRAFRMSLMALRVSWHSIKMEGVVPVLSSKLRNMAVNIRIMVWLLLGRISGKKTGREGVQPRFLSPHEAFTRAIRIYSPQSYPGPAISFRSTSLDFETPDFSQGWAHYITGKLEHQEVFGGHEDIFREPYIAGLADQLMEALAAAYQGEQEYQAK